MVEEAGVACAEPSVLGKCLGIFFGSAIVSAHYRRAFDEDFIVLANLDLHALEDGADTADFIAYRWVAAHGGSGLAQTVANDDIYAA